MLAAIRFNAGLDDPHTACGVTASCAMEIAHRSPLAVTPL
jgi:hypothetical protein